MLAADSSTYLVDIKSIICGIATWLVLKFQIVLAYNLVSYI